jgi:hypothetical protein
MSSFADRSNLLDSFSESSVRILALINEEQLAIFRSNLLRLKDIESDLTSPGADVVLSDCKSDIDRQLAAAFMGLDGGARLLEELKNLSHETNASPLEHIDELHRQAKLKEQHLAAKEGTDIFSSDPIKQRTRVTDIRRLGPSTIAAVPAEPVEEVPLDALASGQEAAVDSSESREYTPGILANGITANEGANSVDSSSYPSQSDSTGSAMDESVEGVSSGHASSAEEADVSNFQVSAADSAPVQDVEERVDTDNLDYSLPEQVPVSAAEDDEAMDEDDDQGPESDRDSREYSPESDVYEPPEPATGAEEAEPKVDEVDEADEAYSPPFIPTPVEDMAESPRSRDQPQAEEALTWAPPGPYLSEPRRDFQIGIFGV